MNVVLKTATGGAAGMFFADYFKKAAVGGPSNGVIMEVGDVLMKFDAGKSPSMTGGNELMPGQVGLRTVITHK